MQAKTENRAMTAEEQASFDAIEKEIADIDKTIEAEERAPRRKTRRKQVTMVQNRKRRRSWKKEPL